MKQKTEQLLKDDRIIEMCPQHTQGGGTEEKIEIIKTLGADTDYQDNLERKKKQVEFFDSYCQVIEHQQVGAICGYSHHWF